MFGTHPGAVFTVIYRVTQKACHYQE